MHLCAVQHFKLKLLKFFCSSIYKKYIFGQTDPSANILYFIMNFIIQCIVCTLIFLPFSFYKIWLCIEGFVLFHHPFMIFIRIIDPFQIIYILNYLARTIALSLFWWEKATLWLTASPNNDIERCASLKPRITLWP